jgi:hypothetical protein
LTLQLTFQLTAEASGAITTNRIQFALVALLPPGNVEGALERLRQKLFSASGDSSFLVLPPLVPVTPAPVEATARDLERALEPLKLRLGFRVRTGDPVHADGALYLGLKLDRESEERLARVRDALAAHWASPGEPLPFRVLPGFLLSPGVPREQDWGLDGAEAEIPPFSAFHYGLVRVECGADQQERWKQVSWEILGTIRSRRPR